MNSVYSIEALIAESTGLGKKKSTVEYSNEQFDGYTDGITQDITSSLESLETVMLYDRIKRSNNEQKIRMIKRLNSVYTKSISNKQVVNSIEEYTSCYDRSIENANPSKLKQFLAFLKKIVKIIFNAIGNFINKFTSIFTGKIKYYTKYGTFSWNKKYNSVNIETLLKNKFIIDIINSKICIAKPNLSNLEKTYKEYIDCISELDSTEKHIGIMGGRGYDDSQKQKYIAYVRDTTIEILKKLENILQTHE